MVELPSLHAASVLVRDRIQDLNDAAAQVRTSGRAAPPRTGPFMRLRVAIGRELISIGCAVAGQRARA